jgi:type IV pilus assembly protein PilX
MRYHPSARRDQSGAALVIAMLLLLVLTMLAVSGMGSAAVEFIMAGNEQYHTRAFQASETGIAQSLQLGVFNPVAAAQTVAGADPNAAPDTYTALLQPQLNGRPQPALWGNDWHDFSTYHFEIQSVGSSIRNSLANHTQGVAILGPASSDVNGPGGI